MYILIHRAGGGGGRAGGVKCDPGSDTPYIYMYIYTYISHNIIFWDPKLGRSFDNQQHIFNTNPVECFIMPEATIAAWVLPRSLKAGYDYTSIEPLT